MADYPVPDFAGLLRQLRTELRLTQEELAAAAGVSTRTISDLERGVNRTAHKDTAELLARALGRTGTAAERFVAAARGRIAAAEALSQGPVQFGPAAERPADWAAASASGPDAAPRTAGMVPRELPTDVTVFTGRLAELARMEALLPAGGSRHEPDDRRGEACGPVTIVVVSGTAGVGKTALAVHWAHHVTALFPDGQLYVNLRGYDPAQPVPAADALAGFLRALGVASQDIPLAEAERAGRYRSLVAGRRLLVVLDNAATVEQVRPLLPGTATALVVVTSRDALAGLVVRDGARRVDLDLLPATDAVALLAALIGERAEGDQAAAQALADRCARLPLALRIAAELAAGRPGTPLAVLAGELTVLPGRVELLDAGGDQHGALASVFSWSYRYLPTEAARLFRLLGLHPGPEWDSHAAAALLSAPVPQAGRLLGTLGRAHLIQPVGTARYCMHDLLRGYATQLATGTRRGQGSRRTPARTEALTRLLDYYLAACAAAMDCLAAAERHQRPTPPATSVPLPSFADRAAARAWLDTELVTLTAVIAFAADQDWPRHAIQIADILRRYLAGRHDTEGLVISAHALDAARRSGDRAAEARALTSLGSFHTRQGRHEQAAQYHQQALNLARNTGDTLTEARALGNLAMAREREGHYQEATDCYRQALRLFRRLGDQAGEAIALHNLGNIAAHRGHHLQAADLQQQAIALFQAIDHRYGEAAALTHLGEALFHEGNYSQAISQLRQALAAARDIGDRSTEAEALTRLGQISHQQGNDHEAASYARTALTLCRETGDHNREAEVLDLLRTVDKLKT